MIFINNKYTKTYYAIVDRANTRTLDCYTEKHHIIPKSLGGSNRPDNLSVLTAREHFICHMLLIKMTTGPAKRKMQLAVSKMLSTSKNQSRYKVTARTYEYIRKQCSEANSGKNNPNYGKKHSAETRKKMGDKVRAHNAKYGTHKHTEEAKKKISESKMGYKHSKEAKDRMSKTRKGRPGQDNNSGKRYYNDGERNYMAHTCPKGCKLGKMGFTKYQFISPDGQLVETTSLTELVKKLPMSLGVLSEINTGARLEYKGWKRA